MFIIIFLSRNLSTLQYLQVSLLIEIMKSKKKEIEKNLFVKTI